MPRPSACSLRRRSPSVNRQTSATLASTSVTRPSRDSVVLTIAADRVSLRLADGFALRTTSFTRCVMSAVLAELRRAERRQRVLAEILHDGERHRADVHARQHRLTHVLGMAHRGEHRLGVVAVAVDDVDALLEELDRVVSSVLHAAGKRADERRAGLHRHVRLVQRVDEVHVDLVTARTQPLAALHALVRDRHLEDRRPLEAETHDALRLSDDLVRRVAERLDLQLRHHLRQPDDRAVDVGDAVAVHERGRRRRAL